MRGGNLWEKDSKEALFVRKFGSRKDTYQTYALFLETRPADVVANILICLIHQASYLLNRQIRQLEKAFLEEGGLRERMSKAALQPESAKYRSCMTYTTCRP